MVAKSILVLECLARQESASPIGDSERPSAYRSELKLTYLKQMTDKEPSAPGDNVEEQTRERVNQVYREYLTALFHRDYYRERHGETLRYARHLDFLISLGAVIGGGSGLGILADPRFAWLCAIITTASLLLSIAKNTYDWSGKLRNSMEMIEAYSKLSLRYLQLVEDIRYRMVWNNDFEERFGQLRKENGEIRPYSYPHWGEKKLREIQNRVKSRVDYENWWAFQR